MISVVIPSRGGPDLEDCLKSLKVQTKKPKEIIVVFDSGEGKNIEIAKKYNARVMFDSSHTIGGAYNKGAKAATGNIVAFIDDDCIAPPAWLKKIEEKFDDDICVFGGEDLLPLRSSFFQKAAYQIDKSRIMKESVYDKKAKNRLRSANIAYRKKIFNDERFNSKLKGLQEPEFHERLFEKGYKMKFDPSVFVYHKRRNSLKEIFFQIYRNGKAKIDLIKLHPRMVSTIDILPILYAVVFLGLSYFTLTGSNWNFLNILLVATLLYILLKPLNYLLRTGDIKKYYICLTLIVFVREVAYGLGILSGLPRLLKR